MSMTPTGRAGSTDDAIKGAGARRVVVDGLVDDGLAAVALTVTASGWITKAQAADMTPQVRAQVARSLEQYARDLVPAQPPAPSQDEAAR